MNMRELIVERILWAVTEEELAIKYHTSEEELLVLTDVDLLELYEDVVFAVE
jgi:hypothetical protein